MRAEITTWHKEVRWGFAATREGKIFFVHEAAFRDCRQIPQVNVGTRIEFDLPVAQTAEQAFLDKLNSGKYRDDPSVARNYRNPRRMVVSNKKPRASNVWVVTYSAA
jgi:hypothetical protein